MKLLVATHFYSTHKGGVEIVAGELSRALAERYGHQITWMASNVSPLPESSAAAMRPLHCSNVTEKWLGFPMPLPFPSALREISRQVLQTQVLIVHDSLYLTNIFATFLARRRSIPVLLIQHIGAVPYKNPVLRFAMALANRLIAKRMLSKANRVVFISGTTKKFFETVEFRRPPALIYNGLRMDLPEPDDRIKFPTERTSIRTILFIGRFVEKKGLSVIRILARRMPDIRWRLCGWGEINPEDWHLPNVEVARDLGPQELAIAYQSSDLLVLPSVGEGLPLVVQEALCFGCPVIASDELILADPWLADEVATAAVDLSDAECTAEAWAKAIPAYGLSNIDRMSLRERARAHYSWNAAAGEYDKILKEMVYENEPHTKAKKAQRKGRIQ